MYYGDSLHLTKHPVDFQNHNHEVSEVNKCRYKVLKMLVLEIQDYLEKFREETCGFKATAANTATSLSSPITVARTGYPFYLENDLLILQSNGIHNKSSTFNIN